MQKSVFFSYICVKNKNNQHMKFPIGIQSFEQIIEDEYIYIDKTDLVYDLTYNCNP